MELACPVDPFERGVLDVRLDAAGQAEVGLPVPDQPASFLDGRQAGDVPERQPFLGDDRHAGGTTEPTVSGRATASSAGAPGRWAGRPTITARRGRRRVRASPARRSAASRAAPEARGSSCLPQAQLGAGSHGARVTTTRLP